MKKYFIFYFLLISFVSLIVAQEIDTVKTKADTTLKYFTIKGVVSEAETKELLPGAVVQLLDTRLGSETNIKGQYLIKDIPKGNYTLSARMMGSETYLIENIYVTNDSFINIKLWPQWFRDPDTTKQNTKKEKRKEPFIREHVVVGDFVRPGLIKGTVVDSITGIALYNALVSINKIKFNKRETDSTGYYRFTNVPVGLYTIIVEKEGYKPIIKKNVKVKRSQMRVFDFKMVK